MLELANYDHDLQYFFQHMAVLLTADTKLRRGLFCMELQKWEIGLY